MTMKVYKFQIQGAGDNYVLVLEGDKGEKEVRARAAEIVGKGRSIALAFWAPGTLGEYLGGEEFEERVRKHWSGSHGARWEMVQKRSGKKAQEAPW